MSNDFPETDWKILSKLKPLALDCLCRKIMMSSEDIIVHAKEGGFHSAYLELFKHIQKQDDILSDCFGDWKRSQALFALVHWRRQNLISDEEFATLSAGTRQTVESFLRRG